MGLRKRLRSAEKANHARATGFYYQALNPLDLLNDAKPRRPTPASKGVKLAAQRLVDYSRQQAMRLANAEQPAITRQQLRRAAMGRY